MVASDSFAELLREQLAPLGHVTMRRMFGKTGVFCDGLMLGMVRDDAPYFRVEIRLEVFDARRVEGELPLRATSHDPDAFKSSLRSCDAYVTMRSP